MKNRIKNYLNDNKEEIVRDAALVTLTLITYTITCKRLGYHMTTPSHYDDNYFYVRTLSGKILRSPKL